MRITCFWLGLGLVWAAQAADSFPTFDFTQAAICQSWGQPHHITAMRATSEGLELSVDGEDPYFTGPSRDYPEGKPLWLVIRLKSDEGGPGQVFFFRDQPREENSAHFQVPAGQWTEARVGLPSLGPGYRLRLDPPGRQGKTVMASISFASAASLAAPLWPEAGAVDFSQAPRLQSGLVALHVADQAIRLSVEGQEVARSHSRRLIGYVAGEQTRWLDLAEVIRGRPRIEATASAVKVVRAFSDPDGGNWQLTESFSVGEAVGAIAFQVTVSCDRDRDLAFFPLMLMVAGAGPNGATKQQGLFAGLEYLENEPGSSEADIIGPESKRQVPSNHKITFPMMAILRQGRYAGVIWDQSPQFSALFDSPDRLLNTGGHVMGVLYPGSDGYTRREGSLMPMRPETLRAGQPLVLKGHLIGGTGPSLVPAIQQYVQLRGLPPITPNDYSLPDYVSLAAHGWLDSGIRQSNLFRHAVWQGFGPQPAADVAVFMDWLADHTADAGLRQRLTETAKSALALVPPPSWDQSAVSHVRYPLQSLVYGLTAENAATAQAHTRALLRRFEADGSIPYRASAGHEDYGRTHFAREANGLTAQVVVSLLEAASFSGNGADLQQAIGKLRGLDKFRNSVPRGAQTWEVPLHTPDILASAHLVRAYTLGYELTGEKDFLDQAIYWAWTGVPFVYLITPVGFPDRPYGTIAVYGATGWRAPVWFGRPVQWCGLVYADALYRLLRHDPGGPWKQLADGITSVGVFYSWPLADKARQGLLPDVWEMLAQRRDGPAINPGTVQANAVRFYTQGPLYDFRVLRSGSRRLLVHAPGDIILSQEGQGLGFSVRAWPRQPYYVLINGVTPVPRVTVNGSQVPLSPEHLFQEKEDRLILRLSGQPTINIDLP